VEMDAISRAALDKAEKAAAAYATKAAWEKARSTLRSTFAEGLPSAEGPEQFPLGRGCPVLVLGIETAAGRVFAHSAKDMTGVQTGLKMALEHCERDTIRLIGTWPGQWRTDQFELNVEQFLSDVL